MCLPRAQNVVRLELYDLANVQKRTTYDFDTRVALYSFSKDGKWLLVLTADQVVYVLDAVRSTPAEAINSLN